MIAFTHLMLKRTIFLILVCCSITNVFSQHNLFDERSPAPKMILGAERTDQYLSILKGKSVALVVNQTSMVGRQHLADTLKQLGVNIKVIFAPEQYHRPQDGYRCHIPIW